MRKTISQLQAAASVTTSDVVAIDNAAGTATLKATVGQIVALAGGGGSLPNGTNDGDVLTWNSYMSSWGPATPFSPPAGTQGDVLTYSSGAWIAAAPSGGGIPAPGSPNDGDVLTWDNTASEWIAAAPTGGNSFDQTLNTTDAVEFASVSMANGSSLAEGSFDSGIGGNFGISLNCVVGYELNWQAGHLACTADGGVTLIPILCDSAIEFPGVGIANLKISNADITFPDGTAQSTAGLPVPPSAMQGDVLTYDTGNWVAQAPSGGGVPNGTNNSDILYWNSTNAAWETTPGNPGTMPTGSTTGDTIKWDSSLGYYVSTPSPVPTSANTNDILAWNGSAWVAVMPSTPGLPSGNSGQYLRYDGTNWNSDRIKVLTWASGDSYGTEDVVAYNGGLWRSSTGANMGNTPAPGSSYWENIGLAPLAAGTSNGDVLTWDSAMSIWTAAAPTGIPAPSMPNDGDVLTYDSTTSAWVAEAPSGGGGISSSVARLTSQFVTNAGAGNDGQRVTGLNVTIDEGTWLIQGLLIVTDAAGLGSVPIDSRLEKEGNTNLYGAFHFKSPDEVACNVVYDQITNMQQIATGAIAGSPPQQRIPFSALAVLDAEQGPTDTIHVRLADGGDNGDDVGCEAGSWIVAIKLS